MEDPNSQGNDENISNTDGEIKDESNDENKIEETLVLAYNESMKDNIVFVEEIIGKELTLEQAGAFFERLGIKDWDPNIISGRHCMECSDNACLPGNHFEIVEEDECECKKCHIDLEKD